MKRDTKERGDMKWDTETMAANYDELTARTIPDMESFYGAVTDVLPEESEKVIELGCGTGILTARIRGTHPDTAIICIDSSEAMLAVARQKTELSGVTLTQIDIREPWPEGPYDAVVSTFCLLALEPDDQRAVLKKAYDVLHPGGVCITGCLVRPPTAEEEKYHLACWETFMQDAGLDPDEIRRQRLSWEEARAKIPTPDGFREMLVKAGFTHIRCPYHHGLYGVFVAER